MQSGSTTEAELLRQWKRSGRAIRIRKCAPVASEINLRSIDLVGPGSVHLVSVIKNDRTGVAVDERGEGVVGLKDLGMTDLELLVPEGDRVIRVDGLSLPSVRGVKER